MAATERDVLAEALDVYANVQRDKANRAHRQANHARGQELEQRVSVALRVRSQLGRPGPVTIK
jgi:hypothetical protein